MGNHWLAPQMHQGKTSHRSLQFTFLLGPNDSVSPSQTKYVGHSAKMALFWDWFSYDPKTDNIMNIGTVTKTRYLHFILCLSGYHTRTCYIAHGALHT